jgi:hypothetical protein
VKDRKLVETKTKTGTLYAPENGDQADAYAPLDDKSLAFGPAAGLKAYLAKLADKKLDTASYPSFSFKDLDPKAQQIAVVIPKRVVPEGALDGKVRDDIKPFMPLLRAQWIAVEARYDDGINVKAKVKRGKDDVKDVQEAGEAGLKMLTNLLAMPLADKKFHDDPENRNLVKLLESLSADVKKIKVETDGDIIKAQVHVSVDEKALTASVAEAVQKVRDAANRSMSTGNLHQIGIAMHNHAATNNDCFPAQAITSKDGKPLLSWRVAILPYIEQEELYKEFKLDEPWDSEHNKKLLAKMPKIYTSPAADLKDNTLTYYKVFVGKDALFAPNRKTNVAQLPAGTSRTFMVIEGYDPVPWTKPDDVQFDAKKPLPKLTGPYKNIVLVMFADASVRTLPKDISEKALKSGIDWNAGFEDSDEPKGSIKPR